MNNWNRLIFIDVDEVLNTDLTTERIEGKIGIDPKLFAEFVRMVKETDAKVVLSSSWKEYPVFHRAFREAMDKGGIGNNYLGHTPCFGHRYSSSKRALEIVDFMTKGAWVYKGKFAVIDDSYNADTNKPNGKFFHVPEETGLNNIIADAVIKYLNE